MLTALSACLPGEFEPQSALVLGFNELLPIYPRVFLDILSAVIDKIPIIGIVENEEQRRQAIALVCDWGLPAHLLHFIALPVYGMWVRDYGPSFVRQADGSIAILDAEYSETARPVDDKVPSELARLLNVPVIQVPLSAEGGNLLSNGKGLCITTEALFFRNRNRGLSREQILERLKQFYGFDQVVALETLQSERTGHADMFVTFVAPDIVLVGQYDPKIDPVNADVLDNNARKLSGLRTQVGSLRVVRIPMPINHGGKWRTYTNVIYANGTLLMPTYEVDKDKEQEATRIYSKLLPGWEVRGIECERLIRCLGALRCASLNIPWLDHFFDRPPQLRERQLLLASAAEYRWP